VALPGSALARYSTRMEDYRTSRLVLRRWKDTDLEAFAQLNADPEVMEHFPGVMDRAASDALVERFEAHFAEHGFGPWAIEVHGGESFIGCVGLVHVGFAASFTPAVELTWRLARRSWGHGYASEAARAVCRFAFAELRLPALVSFTVPANQRSRAVMARLGMTHDPRDDFAHPRFAEGHPLRRHVLYRLSATSWAKGITVREERASDVDAIHRVEAAAFPTDAEAKLVDELRRSGALTLSLVADVAGEVVGHIAFSPISVDSEAGRVVGVGLAPMAVLPAQQRRGIGARLIEEGLARLRAAGHRFCVVLGHPDYYPRHGFVRADARGLRWEVPGHVDSFFVHELAPGALDGAAGVVRYRPEFDEL
jgi:predicted N-acetyltransferase YhbS/RimJ/RimL family protein N-acetyltransferase